MKDDKLVLAGPTYAVGDASHVVSTNTIDVGTTALLLPQEMCWMNVRITTAGTNETSISFTLTDDTAVAMNGTPYAVVSTGAIPVARLTKGAVFSVGFVKDNLRRWLGLATVLVGSAGSCTAEVTLSNQPITNLKIQKLPTA